MYILWPSFRPNGDPLLYLTGQPLVEGKGRCAFVSDVNPYGLEVIITPLINLGVSHLVTSNSSADMCIYIYVYKIFIAGCKRKKNVLRSFWFICIQQPCQK